MPSLLFNLTCSNVLITTIMFRALFSIAVVLLACSSMTSCDGIVTKKYVAVTSSDGSPVCAVNQPTGTVAARSKILCANECMKYSWCVAHQLDDAKKQCQLFNFLPTNYSNSRSAKQCTAYRCKQHFCLPVDMQYMSYE